MSYTDGAWLIDLTPVVDPDTIPAAVGKALGMPPEPDRDPFEGLVASLRSRL